jgi:hypothetical protein
MAGSKLRQELEQSAFGGGFKVDTANRNNKPAAHSPVI